MKEVDKSSLSMFHLNNKSLPKHFDELELYLNLLDFHFWDWQRLGWLNANRNIMTYHIIPASTNLGVTEKVVASHLKYVKA